MWDSRCVIPTPELVTPPATEPVTLAELKAQVIQDLSDDDTLLTSLGIAARQWFENALDRQLVTATWKVRFPFWPGWRIELPYPPLQSSGFILQYKDLALATQTLSSTYYDVVTWTTPGAVQLKNGFAWPPVGIDPGAVIITFQAGYGAASAVPDLIKAGIKLLAGHWYENRVAVGPLNKMPTPLGIDAIVASMRAHRF